MADMKSDNVTSSIRLKLSKVCVWAEEEKWILRQLKKEEDESRINEESKQKTYVKPNF